VVDNITETTQLNILRLF